jgi:hypothetical protein
MGAVKPRHDIDHTDIKIADCNRFRTREKIECGGARVTAPPLIDVFMKQI